MQFVHIFIMIETALNKETCKSIAFKEVEHKSTLNMVLPVIQTLETGIMFCDGKV